jgi:hypothetical protein
MQLPSTDPARQEVKDALRALRDDPRFAVVTAWVKEELRLRDKANRVIGYENKSSEAECLADFLEIVAACAALDADSDAPTESGAESMSALLTM